MANVYCNDRTICLYDAINPETTGTVNSYLLTLINQDDIEDKKQKNYEREVINLHINSNGGSIYDTWSLIDIILKSKTPIHTYCTGRAMSGAFMIFLSGHKRFISEHATLLYHQVSTSYNGYLENIINDVDESKRLQDQMESFVLSNCDIKHEKLKEIREKKIDWYITPEEAIKLKVADEIL